MRRSADLRKHGGWRWLAALLAAHPTLVLLPLLSGLLATALTLPALWLMRFALDRTERDGSVALLLAAGGGILLSRALSSAAVLAVAHLTVRESRAVVAAMREELHARLLRLQWTDYVGMDRARLHARLVHDTERVEQLVAGTTGSALPAVAPLVCFLALLFWIDWPLAFVVLAAAPLSRVLTAGATILQHRAITQFQARFERFHVGTQKALKMLTVTRQQGTEAEARAEYGHVVGELARSGTRLVLANAVSQQANVFAGSLVIVAVLVAGGIEVIDGAISIGTLAVFVFASNLVSAAIGSIGTAVPLALSANEALRRLAALRVQGEIDSEGEVSPALGAPLLAFEGVSFAHGDRRIVDCQSFRIERGAITAIAAPNGSGKTTLLELAAGLLRPMEGRILADGLDLATIDRAAWRRSLGYVPQQPVFFRGTLGDNILHGRDTRDRSAFEGAAHASTLDAVLARLPAGLDTAIGDDGLMLSGGELQCISIARALVHRPSLLILDEPTNHLDTVAVGLLAERLFAARSRTVLMATHDPRLLALADHVYDLVDGVLCRRMRPADREVA